MLLAAALVALLAWAGTGAGAQAEVAPDPVLLAAGDIGDCTRTSDEATAAILDANPNATVAALGDLAYENGTATEFANCYGPTWGRHKARTHPSVGNHEYNTSGASGYFGYFGAAAGTPGQGWYSYDLGAWHVVVLNSNCSEVDCSVGSQQEQWLRADLAAHAVPCTLAYWHHPRFASDLDTSTVQPLWAALYDFGADVVLAGHQHNYERFPILGRNGQSEPARGIRSFIVGTGGAGLHSLSSPEGEVANDSTYGVIKLTLHPQGYSWNFLPIAGRTFTDSGSEACRPAADDTTPPTRPTGLTASASAGRVDLAWQPSTDAVGVAGYDILRDGAVIATVGPSTTYTDSSVAGRTMYSYAVRARDLSGNVSALSDAVSVTTPAAPTVLTFTPAADARVQESSAGTNYGTSTLVGTDAGPAVETYLRFDVTGLTGVVAAAKLRLYATNGSVDGPAAYPTGSAWTEAGLTWSNRPSRTGPPADDRAVVTSGAYNEWDVTPLVGGNGIVAFNLAQPGTDGADFTSKEGPANRPQLVVTVLGDPPPPDESAPSVPTNLVAAASPGQVDLSWTGSTDNAGVAGYDVFRNGALLVQIGATTTHTDATVAPNTAYSYAVRARDAAGNISALSDPVSITTPAAPTTLTFAPISDTRVQEATPSSNFGTSTALGTDAGPAVETNLRFDLGTLPGSVVSARLRLYVTNGSADGPAVYPTGTSWDETTVTWSNRPARTGAAANDLGSLSSGGYAEWNVTSLVLGGGPVAFALAQPGTDGADFTSKEGAVNRPQLVVTVSGDPPPPPPPPDTSSPTVPTGLAALTAPGRVDLSWTASADDVAVTGYDVFRNGALLTQIGATTTYADTAVAPNTAYSYAVRARDAAGNVSALSDPAAVTTPSAPTTLTFLPAADARVQEAKPTTNYGTSNGLGTDAGPAVATYLRFDLGALPGPVQSARLRLFATNGTVDGPAVHGTATLWTETGLTWSNRPAATTAGADDRAAIARSAFVEWDVTSLVAGGGMVGLLLSQPGTDGADFSSKESATNRPQLVVVVGS